jgi:hypothetical protein
LQQLALNALALGMNLLAFQFIFSFFCLLRDLTNQVSKVRMKMPASVLWCETCEQGWRALTGHVC